MGAVERLLAGSRVHTPCTKHVQVVLRHGHQVDGAINEIIRFCR